MGKLADFNKSKDKKKRVISDTRPMNEIKGQEISNKKETIIHTKAVKIISDKENIKETTIHTDPSKSILNKANIKVTNSKQTKNKKKTNNFKIVTSAAYAKLSKQKNELIAEFEVMSNTGIGKHFLIKYCFEPCLKRGVDTTEALSIIGIALSQKYKSRDVLQVTINRLEKKGIIRNIYGRRGRNGFSVYQVNSVALKAYERLLNSNNPYCKL